MIFDKPKQVVKIGDEEVELYYINALASALGRTSQTIRKWEIAGIIPDAIFRDKNGRRLYTKEQIEIMVRIAEECKITQGKSVAGTGFTKKVYKALEEHNKKYLEYFKKKKEEGGK